MKKYKYTAIFRRGRLSSSAGKKTRLSPDITVYASSKAEAAREAKKQFKPNIREYHITFKKHEGQFIENAAKKRKRRNPDAADVYETVHWGDMVDEQIETTIDIPDTFAAIGELVAVEYDTHKAGEKAIWRHEFKKKNRPILCTNPEGDQLYIIGGQYKIKEEGITD